MIGKWLENILRNKGIRQNKLAEMMSDILQKPISAQRINNTIKGRSHFADYELVALQEILGLRLTLEDIGIEYKRPVEPHPKAEIPIDIQLRVIEFLGERGALAGLSGKEAASLVTTLCIALKSSSNNDVSIEIFYEILSALNQAQLMEELDPQKVKF